MHTIDEIMTVAPAADDINGSAPDEVVSGRTYWGLRTDGSWGTQTGTRAPCTADADADGIPDCNDQCPSDPDKGLPGACGCGVQESGGDWDGDGVVDCLDLCPLPGDEVMVGDACFSLLQQCLVIVSVTPDANGDGCIDGFSGAPSASCSQCTPLCGPITIGGPP
jgi:hypothetical protein